MGRKSDYYDKMKKALAHPYYSMIIILGVPLRFTLTWGLYESGTDYLRILFDHSFFWDSLLAFIIIIGPVATLIYYAHCTGNKLSSALFGFLLYSLMFFYAMIINIALNNYPIGCAGFFELPFMFSTIHEILPFSILHASMGFLSAFKKRSYFAIVIMLFIVNIATLIHHFQETFY